VSTPVPPHSAIEVELTWKIVRLPGVGLFAGSAGASLCAKAQLTARSVVLVFVQYADGRRCSPSYAHPI
jgi:hypothetical protein